MTDYTYSRVAALNFNTTPVTVGRSATGSVYAVGDTTFTTPLNLTTVVGGVTGTSISSDANGFFPDFTVANRTSVVFKQAGTSFTSVLTTTDPVPGAKGDPGNPGTPGVKGDRGDLATWQATTFYPLNQVIANPSGDLVKVTTAHTSGVSYDATKFGWVNNNAANLTGILPEGSVPARLEEAALDATILNKVSDDAADPEGVIQGTILEVVTPLLGNAGIVIIEHGDNATMLRRNTAGETFTGPAMWVGTVVPLNRISGDFYFNATVEPIPVLVWSDTIPTDGALGTTETGGLAYQVAGTGYAGAKASGHLVFSAGTTSLGAITVDDGQTDCIYRVTLVSKGPNFGAGIVIRWADISNHLILNRVSATDGTYRLSRRVAGTYTHIVVLTGHVMTDGDDFEITTLATGELKIVLNGVTVHESTVTNFATATARGVFCLVPTDATSVAYDDLSVTTVV